MRDPCPTKIWTLTWADPEDPDVCMPPGVHWQGMLFCYGKKEIACEEARGAPGLQHGKFVETAQPYYPTGVASALLDVSGFPTPIAVTCPSFFSLLSNFESLSRCSRSIALEIITVSRNRSCQISQSWSNIAKHWDTPFE